VNREVAIAADAQARFVVAVDDVRHSSAFGAATFERGGITIALSSSGAAPALVALLRRGLERLVPHDVGQWRELAEGLRPAWRAAGTPMASRRLALLGAINALYTKDTDSEAHP
jgi:siroheme synthase-like protein